MSIFSFFITMQKSRCCIIDSSQGVIIWKQTFTPPAVWGHQENGPDGIPVLIILYIIQCIMSSHIDDHFLSSFIDLSCKIIIDICNQKIAISVTF